MRGSTLVLAIALVASPAVAADAPPVMNVVNHVAANLRFSEYSHVTKIDEKHGDYRFDCSGMVAWVLGRAAPRARSAIGGGRPLARDFYARIRATPPGKARWGWLRVPRVADAAPGDVIAWLKPKEIHSPNTGHVAFVVEAPRPFSGVAGGYLVRIADASQYQHQDDSRAGTGLTGFGTGTILVVADPDSGAPVAYGWFGAESTWILDAKMAIGRPVG